MTVSTPTAIFVTSVRRAERRRQHRTAHAPRRYSRDDACSLRNNGYDISYVNYGQTIYDAVAAGDDDEATSIPTRRRWSFRRVSGYRNGSNACLPFFPDPICRERNSCV